MDTEERTRERPGRWFWLFALLITAIVAWGVIELFTQDDAPGDAHRIVTVVPPDEAKETPRADQERTPGFDRFSRFVRDSSGAGVMDTDHGYTSSGIRYLAEALTEIAEREGRNEIAMRADTLVKLAEMLQKEPGSNLHADLTHEAFTIADQLIEQLQSAVEAQGETTVRSVTDAPAIEPDRPLLDQRTEVKTYFKRAVASLASMRRNHE